MGYLEGFNEYLEAEYGKSVFDQALASQTVWEFHLYGPRVVKARVLENLVYDVRLAVEGEGEEEVSKLHVKFLYPAEHSDVIRPLLKLDKKVRALGLEPIRDHRGRYYIKNKTLYPLMKDREVVFCTVLEGDLLRGLITGFSRFELEISLKGGVPVTLLRHAIYNLENKKGRCFLKNIQDEQRDWEKSPLYVPTQPATS